MNNENYWWKSEADKEKEYELTLKEKGAFAINPQGSWLNEKLQPASRCLRQDRTIRASIASL